MRDVVGVLHNEPVDMTDASFPRVDHLAPVPDLTRRQAGQAGRRHQARQDRLIPQSDGGRPSAPPDRRIQIGTPAIAGALDRGLRGHLGRRRHNGHRRSCPAPLPRPPPQHSLGFSPSDPLPSPTGAQAPPSSSSNLGSAHQRRPANHPTGCEAVRCSRNAGTPASETGVPGPVGCSGGARQPSSSNSGW